MSQRRRPSDDGGLTPEHFEALLRALDPMDRDRAARLYEALRRKLIHFFGWRGCVDPEALVDETLDRVARRLHEGVAPADPVKYVYGVARFVYQEVLRESIRERQAMESGELPSMTATDAPEENPRLDALRVCLDKMEHGQRRLLLRYYQSDHRIHDRKKISDELGIPINALRIKVHRLRRRLEECLGLRPGR